LTYLARLSVLLLFLLGTAAPSLSQPHVHFQRLEVAIWPEYDQPAALVMYRGVLAPDVQLPVTVSLPMPASVSLPNAVAKRGPGTNLLVAPYTIETGSQWNIVHLQTDLPEIRLEFYVALATEQAERTFLFEWPGGAEIDEAAYEVMQPWAATELKVAPSSSPPARGQDGLIYQREDLGPIPEGGTFFVELSYTKQSPELTVAALQPVSQPTQPAPPPSTSVQVPSAEPESSSPSTGNSAWYVVIPIVFLAGLAAGWILLSIGKEKSS
jgi:hypothetical protein